jgi:very-short-patch-repair endonuclease
VTGPPGTGKSQFIANLIVNLFLQKKKVLFVSHTGEAVRVVNERINQNFANLMMQTGRKEIRQELGKRLDEMVEQYNDLQANAASESPFETISQNWSEIGHETAYVQQTDKLHKDLERKLHLRQTLSRRSGIIQIFSKSILRIQISLLARSLQRRSPNYEVLAYIEKLKARHVDISQAYVKANYLTLILENGLYGKLVAYIEAIQNKKFTYGNVEDKSEKYIHVALQAMNIWSCTLKSLSATFPLRANLFDYVIFDEASQIDLPSAAPALYRAKSAVVVGDENQLNHIAKINPKLEEELAMKYALSDHGFYPALVRYTDVSLFNSAKKALNEPEQELKNHYRSNTLIAKLFSSVFYGGRLKIHEPESTLPPDIQPGVYWVDVKGSSYKHKTGSRYNSQEVAYVLKLLERLIPVANERGLTIGVTTPYSRQRDLLSTKIDETFDSDQLANVRVLTVHRFQGSEVDILIFSPVLAQKGNGSSDYWYIKNKQILNVAISRAKQLLLITGDLDFALHSQSKLKEIAQYCRRADSDEVTRVPNRPMNVFEKELLTLLKKTVPKTYKIEPQYIVGNRFTVDFALLSKDRKIVIELDGHQHEIIGGLPVFEDKQRDAYLSKTGWEIIRITVHELVKRPYKVEEILLRMLGEE